MEWFTRLVPDDLHQRVITGIVIFLATTVVSLLLGRWWGKYKAMQEWHNKRFMNRILVSLNTFADGYLKIRTVFERSLDAVFINPTAAERVMAACRQTTRKQPTLLFAKEDRWFLLNYVLNAVAEEYNGGLIRYDSAQGLTPSATQSPPVRPVKYLLWLTCEPLGPDRIRKVRAMMIRKDLLLSLPTEMPLLEQQWHADRMDTLHAAAELYKAEPDNFLTLEVYV
jgi:hypothetical protein